MPSEIFAIYEVPKDRRVCNVDRTVESCRKAGHYYIEHFQADVWKLLSKHRDEFHAQKSFYKLQLDNLDYRQGGLEVHAFYPGRVYSYRIVKMRSVAEIHKKPEALPAK